MTIGGRLRPAFIRQAGLAHPCRTMNDEPRAIPGAERSIKQLELRSPTYDRPPLERDCHRLNSIPRPTPERQWNVRSLRRPSGTLARGEPVKTLQTRNKASWLRERRGEHR